MVMKCRIFNIRHALNPSKDSVVSKFGYPNLICYGILSHFYLVCRHAFCFSKNLVGQQGFAAFT
jgi:hypothetical protein